MGYATSHSGAMDDDVQKSQQNKNLWQIEAYTSDSN